MKEHVKKILLKYKHLIVNSVFETHLGAWRVDGSLKVDWRDGDDELCVSKFARWQNFELGLFFCLFSLYFVFLFLVSNIFCLLRVCFVYKMDILCFVLMYFYCFSFFLIHSHIDVMCILCDSISIVLVFGIYIFCNCSH